jgi:hypothetical protein
MQTLYGEQNPIACIVESVKESTQLDQVSYRFARVSADLASSSSQIAECIRPAANVCASPPSEIYHIQALKKYALHWGSRMWHTGCSRVIHTVINRAVWPEKPGVFYIIVVVI